MAEQRDYGSRAPDATKGWDPKKSADLKKWATDMSARSKGEAPSHPFKFKKGDKVKHPRFDGVGVVIGLSPTSLGQKANFFHVRDPRGVIQTLPEDDLKRA